MKKFLKYFLRTLISLFIVLNIATAFFAYKFTHFNDNGFNVAVSDNSSSWHTAKTILFDGFSKLKNDVKPDSTFQVIYLTTKDNLKLEGWYLKTDSTPKGTVILFHGHGSNKSAVIDEAREFNEMGYNAFLLDFRAHGGSEGNICTIGYYETEDVKLAYDFIQRRGEKNIILWGISLGAATIIKTVNDSAIQPSKIILEMPYGSLLQATEGKMRMMHIPAEPLAAMIMFWGGTEQGFWAFNVKPYEYAKKINCPVLLQWGKNDKRVSKEEIDAIYNNIHSPKQLVIYDSCGHESLCDKENDKWELSVSNFLMQ
jgi:alpha-beta hydrolase superfamily lysophospholipase